MSRQLKILKERAEKLARVLHTPMSLDNIIDILVFKIGEEKYGIETRFIQEIFPLKDYTPLPCVPPFIYGLVNIRRKILSIFDLRAFFNLPATERETNEKELVILKENEIDFALLTDGIDHIQHVPLSQIQVALPTSLSDKQDFIKGITSEKVVLLDGHKLLASKQIIIDEQVEI